MKFSIINWSRFEQTKKGLCPSIQQLHRIFLYYSWVFLKK